MEVKTGTMILTPRKGTSPNFPVTSVTRYGVVKGYNRGD